MESTKTNISKSACSVSNTRMYTGENNEIICVKVYKGDWGHWDEKPEHNQNAANNADRISTDSTFEGI